MKNLKDRTKKYTILKKGQIERGGWVRVIKRKGLISLKPWWKGKVITSRFWRQEKVTFCMRPSNGQDQIGYASKET